MMEFSKKLVYFTGALFLFTLIEMTVLTVKGFEISSLCMQQIISTAGVFSATICFYLNKAKIENVSKGKIEMILLELQLELKLKKLIPEENYNKAVEAIREIKSMHGNKMNSALEEAINKDITEDI